MNQGWTYNFGGIIIIFALAIGVILFVAHTRYTYQPDRAWLGAIIFLLIIGTGLWLMFYDTTVGGHASPWGWIGLLAAQLYLGVLLLKFLVEVTGYYIPALSLLYLSFPLIGFLYSLSREPRLMAQLANQWEKSPQVKFLFWGVVIFGIGYILFRGISSKGGFSLGEMPLSATLIIFTLLSMGIISANPEVTKLIVVDTILLSIPVFFLTFFLFRGMESMAHSELTQFGTFQLVKVFVPSVLGLGFLTQVFVKSISR